jgi:Na+-transporting methylmalonyl-CoA/oxaloacetate decarboxylase gamma subunit
MNNLDHGLVLTLVGMGGTLVSLWLIILVVGLLKRLFPYMNSENHKEGKDAA